MNFASEFLMEIQTSTDLVSFKATVNSINDRTQLLVRIFIGCEYVWEE